jgi:hypothetical protein
MIWRNKAMKKIATVALAGLMGVSALAMTAGTAAAHPQGQWPHHDHHWNHGPGWGWGWGAPFVLGLGVGTLYGNNYDYSYRYGDDHVRWCEAHYRTYNPRTDTFFVRPGVPARCVAPFDRY